MNRKQMFLELFKTHKLKNYRKTMVGFGSLFWRIVRRVDKDVYAYGFRDFTIGEYRLLYSGKHKLKLLTPLVLSNIGIMFNLFWIPFVVITYLPYSYFEGAKNWITDSAWINNVRFFNWVNLILVVVLTITLIIKW